MMRYEWYGIDIERLCIRKLKKEYPNSFRDDPPEEEMFGDSINEDTRDFKKVDNPKQHALYNKIAEDVVSLIKYEKNKKVSITDLRDPRHPGVGMSLPPPIISIYELRYIFYLIWRCTIYFSAMFFEFL